MFSWILDGKQQVLTTLRMVLSRSVVWGWSLGTPLQDENSVQIKNYFLFLIQKINFVQKNVEDSLQNQSKCLLNV